MPRSLWLGPRTHREDCKSTDISANELATTGAAFLHLTFSRTERICTIVKEIQLSRPELAFIIVTRAILGAGIALLLADRLNAGQRKAVGSTLALVGLVTTIPAAWAIFGKCE